MITIEALRKSFRSHTVLDGIGFAARDGAVTALVGANGAGKTTTFRICAGVLAPDSGRVLVDGRDSSPDGDGARRRLALLSDARGLHPRQTAREAVRLAGRLRGLGGYDLEARIGALAERLAMADFLDRPARGLSRGQAVKVGLARTLVAPVQNIILDEPTAGLDFVSANAVWEIVADLRASGAAVLIASHHASEIVPFADRVVALRDGRITADGALVDLMAASGAADPRAYLLSCIAAPEA